MRIVPAFDELKDGRMRSGWGVEGGAVQQLAFEGGEKERTVTVDLLSRRAVRIEKPKSGKIRQTEINLGEVSRVLIDCQAVGHLCRLVLEAQNKPPFEVNSAYDFVMGPLEDLGKKLSGLPHKPVILKWSEGGKVESEEEI